jgi:TRAP-type C4-dicarboxylate transport system permease small subunit
MTTLQTQKHNAVRSVLRVIGPLVAVVGLVFMIVGTVSFFSAFGGNGSPKLFWCCFVGLPLLFVGGVMCMLGFLGAMARYAAAEQVPVATDAFNELAEGTQSGVKTVARAVAEGIRDGYPPKKN